MWFLDLRISIFDIKFDLFTLVFMLSWFSPKEPVYFSHNNAFCVIANVLRYLQISCSLHAAVMTLLVMILIACLYEANKTFHFSVLTQAYQEGQQSIF